MSSSFDSTVCRHRNAYLCMLLKTTTLDSFVQWKRVTNETLNMDHAFLEHYTLLLKEILAVKRFSTCVFQKSGSKVLNLASPEQLQRTWNKFLDDVNSFKSDSIVIWFRDFVTVQDRIDKLREVFIQSLNGNLIGCDEID